MAKVIATQRGYFGKVLRDPGDAFDVPDEIMADDKLRPSWVRLARRADLAADAEAVAAPADAEGPKRAGRKPRAETVAAPVAAPFIEAPEPVRVENEINAATGATQPDWVAPAAGDI